MSNESSITGTGPAWVCLSFGTNATRLALQWKETKAKSAFSVGRNQRPGRFRVQGTDGLTGVVSPSLHLVRVSSYERPVFVDRAGAVRRKYVGGLGSG